MTTLAPSEASSAAAASPIPELPPTTTMCSPAIVMFRSFVETCYLDKRCRDRRSRQGLCCADGIGGRAEGAHRAPAQRGDTTCGARGGGRPAARRGARTAHAAGHRGGGRRRQTDGLPL